MKRILTAALALLMLLSLAACGETADISTENDASASETVVPAEEGFQPSLSADTKATLYFVGSWGNFEALDQVALNFQAYYPGVEVVYVKLDDYRNDLANRFVTGEEIDLFMTDWWDVDYPQSADIIANAEDLNTTEIDFSHLNADMLSLGVVDGAQLMVPIYQQTFGFMINLDLFEAAGAEIPTTYSELLTACEVLAAAGYEQPIYEHDTHYGRSFCGYYLNLVRSGMEEHEAMDATLARMDELMATGYVNTEGNSLADSYNAMILRFFEGDIPMQPIPAANYSGTAKREANSEAFTANPFSYTYIPVPYGDEVSDVYLNELGSIYVGVYKNSPQAELANEFLRFLLTDEEMLVLEQVKNQSTSNINNGMELVPCFADRSFFSPMAEGMSGAAEAAAVNSLKNYSSDSADHSEILTAFEGYLENGFSQ